MGAADKLLVGGLTPCTTLDYPGELSAVVFCQGCPWRCRYCHNPALLPTRTPHAIPWAHVLDLLHRRTGLLDAVVFSGGEPTRQPALLQAVTEVKGLGYKVGLHSAGIYPKRLARLLPLLDWVGLDVKAPLTDYPAITGVKGSGHAAWESARHVIESGVAHELRITVHPALTPRAQINDIATRLRALGAHTLVEQACRQADCLDPALRSPSP